MLQIYLIPSKVIYILPQTAAKNCLTLIKIAMFQWDSTTAIDQHDAAENAICTRMLEERTNIIGFHTELMIAYKKNE